jgi:phosphatidylglycerol---prolipoprotein diacylglyceryl transferase
MNPIAFHVGSWPVYWYGLCMAGAFLAAITHWEWLGRRQGRPKGFGSDLAMWIIAGGVIGARVAYVLAHWEIYRADPVSVFALREGGLVFYGGALGGVLAVALFARRRNLPLGRLGDYAVSGLPLGHAIGRLGCFTRGCCYGAPCPECDWSVVVEGVARHPVQLYEAAANGLVYAALVAIVLRAGPRRPGLTVAAYGVLYGGVRFFMEFLRGDERLVWAGLNLAQWTSLAFIAAGAGWMVFRRRGAGASPSPASPFAG